MADLPEIAVRRHRNVTLKLAIGLFLLFIVVRVGGGRGPAAPDLAADCVHPSFALPTTKIQTASVLRYTLVGPADRRYVLAVDSVSVRRDPDGRYRGVPAVAGAPTYITPPQQPVGCRATGKIGLPFERPGTHTVTMFETLPDGSATKITSQTVTVGGDRRS